MLLSNYPYKWKHKKCGKICFFAKKFFTGGDIVKADEVIYINGMKPNPAEVIKCKGCGETISPISACIEQSRRNA